MRHLTLRGGAVVLTLLSTVGCQSMVRRGGAPPPPPQPEPQMPPAAMSLPPAPIQDDRLERRMTELEDKYRTLREDNDRLLRQVGAIKLRVERMESNQKSGEIGAIPSSGVVASPFDPKAGADPAAKPFVSAPVPVPGRGSSDPSALVEALRNERSPEKVDALLRQVSTAGVDVVPSLIRGLGDNDFEFRSRAEKALAVVPARISQSFLLDELKRNPDSRIRVVRILGLQGDPSAVPHLFTYLGDKNNSELRFAAAGSLVQLKAKEGIPILIEGLKSSDAVKCALAFDILRKATGQEFGYKYYASTSDRELSARKWDAWWKENGPRFEFTSR
ncbi:MAG: HEAT repeat domain-containing protein [Planctomycetes bacterium]|nr:HEAT repeat domain-containing protein [Planctomycetota bacterium]